MSEAVPGMVHRHFKGEEKQYLVLFVSVDVEPPHVERVCYVPLYGENKGIVLSRERTVWEQEVKRDGYEGPRFWPLSKKTPRLS